MSVGVFSVEVAKLGTGDAAGIIDLGARDRVILSLVSADNALRGFSGTSGTNGEIAISSNVGVTSNSVVLAVPNESAGAVHVIPGANKITVYAAGTTNVVASKKFAVLVVQV